MVFFFPNEIQKPKPEQQKTKNCPDRMYTFRIILFIFTVFFIYYSYINIHVAFRGLSY